MGKNYGALTMVCSPESRQEVGIALEARNAPACMPKRFILRCRVL